MAYIMDDDKGYIEFKKERGMKKKSNKHRYKNKMKMKKLSRRNNRKK